MTHSIRCLILTAVSVVTLQGCTHPGGQKAETMILAPMSVKDLACEAWERSGSTRARVSLSIKTDSGNDYIVGVSEKGKVRYLVSLPADGLIYLAMSHQDRDTTVSHAFKASDYRPSLMLTAGAKENDSDTFDLACLIKSEIP